MNSLMWRVLTSGAILVTVAMNAPAATYKWVDEQGQVHYTQTPPPSGVQGETVKPPPKVDTESAVKELKAKDKGFDKRLEKQTEQAEEQQQTMAEAEEKKAYCVQLQGNLNGLQNSQRIYEKEGDIRRRITQEERQARIKETQEKIAKDCK